MGCWDDSTPLLHHSITPRLLISERLYRIEPRGLNGGEDTRDHPDQDAEGEGDSEGGNLNDRRVVRWRERTDQVDQREGSRQPGQATEDGDDDGLDEDLGKDVARGRADGFADADFAHPLGDTGEHDVHDANAAHQQANAGNETAAQTGVVDKGVD